MSKKSLLKFSKWMVVVLFVINILFAQFVTLLLDNDPLLLFMVAILFLQASPYIIAAFIFKHIIEKTQSNTLLTITIAVESYLLFTELLDLGNSILSAIMTADATGFIYLFLLLLMLIMLLCDVLALSRPKD